MMYGFSQANISKHRCFENELCLRHMNYGLRPYELRLRRMNYASGHMYSRNVQMMFKEENLINTGLGHTILHSKRQEG